MDTHTHTQPFHGVPSSPPPPLRTGHRGVWWIHTCARAVSARVRWWQRVPLALAETPHRGLLIDAVLIDGVYVVLGGLQSPQLGAQVAVLAAIRGPGPSWKKLTGDTEPRLTSKQNLLYQSHIWICFFCTEMLKSAENQMNDMKWQQYVELIGLLASPSCLAQLPNLISL